MYVELGTTAADPSVTRALTCCVSPESKVLVGLSLLGEFVGIGSQSEHGGWGFKYMQLQRASPVRNATDFPL